ncbi:MAG: hypothetical protein PVG07_08820 [Acidobacteriota bacterium]|jgi:hypothetical protein
MSVQELQRLHGRYSDLSHRFRAAWAFNQYLESLRKVFTDGERPDVSAEFQEIHGVLKSVSERLGGASTEELDDELDAVDRRLGELASTLVDEDSRVQPETVRQFFQRVKNQGDNLLTQLVKFYVYGADHETPWPEDRLDKVDFLLTRVAGERDSTGRFTLIERGRLREIVTGLWNLLGSAEPEPELVERSLEAIRKLRTEVASASGLDGLNERRMVPRYRELKHRLDRYVFFPKILVELLETNLVYKNVIRQLYSVEERRIVAEYQRVFDLEREVALDGELEAELRDFRTEVEAFEKSLQEDEIKLDELVRLRRQVRSLSKRLAERSRDGGSAGLDWGPPPAESGDQTPEEEVLREPLERLRATLAEVDPEMPPGRAVLTSTIFPLRLEAREVVAFRRLSEVEAADGNPEIERIILEAAALRVAINEQVEEIQALLDETSVTGEAPVFARARRILRLASTYVARLEDGMHRAMLQGRTAEAQSLLVLRMRLVRDYTGGWLVAIKPLLSV